MLDDSPPRMSELPANPASAPEASIAKKLTRMVRIPPCRAASSFAPVKRSRNPNVVRLRTNAIANAIAIARMKSHESEVCSRSRGHRALSKTGPDRGKVPVGSCRGPRTSQLTSWMAMRFSMRVEMISLTPRLTQSTAAIPIQIVPPTIPARTASGRWMISGRPPRFRPTIVARIPPARIWPSSPMFTRRTR